MYCVAVPGFIRSFLMFGKLWDPPCWTTCNQCLRLQKRTCERASLPSSTEGSVHHNTVETPCRPCKAGEQLVLPLTLVRNLCFLCTPAPLSVPCSPSPAPQWKGCWAGNKEMKKKSGQKKLLIPWWRSWRRKKEPWKNWRGLWAAQVSPVNASQSHVPWMGGCRCLTARGFPTSYIAECGAGLTYNLTMSWNHWNVVSSLLAQNKKKCASTPTITGGWKHQVIMSSANDLHLCVSSCSGRSNLGASYSSALKCEKEGSIWWKDLGSYPACCYHSSGSQD